MEVNKLGSVSPLGQNYSSTNIDDSQMLAERTSSAKRSVRDMLVSLEGNSHLAGAGLEGLETQLDIYESTFKTDSIVGGSSINTTKQKLTQAALPLIINLVTNGSLVMDANTITTFTTMIGLTGEIAKQDQNARFTGEQAKFWDSEQKFLSENKENISDEQLHSLDNLYGEIYDLQRQYSKFISSGSVIEASDIQRQISNKTKELKTFKTSLSSVKE